MRNWHQEVGSGVHDYNIEELHQLCSISEEFCCQGDLKIYIYGFICSVVSMVWSVSLIVVSESMYNDFRKCLFELNEHASKKRPIIVW